MGVAVVLVGVYLGLTAAVLAVALNHLAHHPNLFADWETRALAFKGNNPLAIAFFVAIVFPKLALGLSGFETGVAVMPLVAGSRGEGGHPQGRVRNTRKLLLSAGLIMSIFLMLSSVATSMVIPPDKMAAKGEANARALSWIAHQYMGDAFGTVYDVATILILWFAGASAMAGLLNIVPRYLPRYGMAPEWAKANRPLVLVFTAISVIVTLIFKASVEAQGAAYATGVLFLMTSAAFAVAWSLRKRKSKGVRRYLFWGVFAIFCYTFVQNVFEKPDGLKIASVFIGVIVLVSLVSRIWRTLELRVDSVNMDLLALDFVGVAAEGDHSVRLIPNRPEIRDVAEYDRKAAEVRRDHDIPASEGLIFVEIEVADASDFAGSLDVRGSRVGPHMVLRAKGVAIPNAIAALLMHVRDYTAKRPHAYFNWGESSPVQSVGKLLFSGQGDIAPVTREIVRRVEPEETRRPVIHVAS